LASLATDLFDYALSPHLIAQEPVARRDRSRLLVVDRSSRSIEHAVFADLPRFLRSGDTLFRNNAAVLPARLHGRRPTGGAVECFLLRPANPADATDWHCLLKPGKRLPTGATFSDPGGAFVGEVRSKSADGTALVRFATPNGESIAAIANRLGDVPLPPYIVRSDDSRRAADLERYQTVYADPARQVAVAAPTAGLHFTPELLAALAAKGVFTAELTLHVGLGTFKPIVTPTIETHAIHREIYELPASTRRSLEVTGGRRIAVGTTTVRSLEDYLATRADVCFSRGGCAHHQLPPTPVDAPLSGGGVSDARIDRWHRLAQVHLRRGHRPRIPLLQLRRRDADPLIRLCRAPRSVRLASSKIAPLLGAPVGFPSFRHS
jgi:S-adenosylmethionine:tRNA ribosyltransferase-isomerase